MVNFRKIISFIGFLTAVVFVPLFLATCGSSSDSTPAAEEPAATKFLYVVSDDSAGSGDNLLVKIDISDNSVVSSTAIGFFPSWPANNHNSGSILWGTDSDGTTTKLYGVNVTDGTSALKPSFAATLLKMFAKALGFAAPEIAQAKPAAGPIQCDLSSNKLSAPAAATWNGTAVAGGGTWTAVSSDGSKIWVANRVDTAAENGVYEMYNTSGVLQLTVDPVTGVTKDGTGATVNDFSSQYVADGGTMPGGNAGISVAEAGPCDISISTIGGTEYGWGVDVNGDTLTGFNAATGFIVGQMIYKALGPVQEAMGFIAPFMGTAGTTANGTAIVTMENLRGARSESIMDVSTPASPVELIRIYENFLWDDDADTNTPDVAWNFTTGTLANYQDVSMANASRLTGAVTTTIYEWATPDAGYPMYIIDGLVAGTTSEIAPNGKFAYILGGNLISVVDLTEAPPWFVATTIDTSATGGSTRGTFTSDSAKFYISSGTTGVLPEIDTSTHTIVDLIAVTGKPGGGAIL